MTYLLTILLTLWADRQFPNYVDLRRFSVYRFFAKSLIRLGLGNSSTWLPYVLLTVLPALIIKWIISTFSFFIVLELLCWAVALYICLPIDPVGKRVQAYILSVQSGNEKESAQHAQILLGTHSSVTLADRNTAICRILYSEKNLHIVSLFFWFYFLGIGGAFFYKLNWLLKESEDNRLRSEEVLQAHVQMALGLLTWVPARLLMLAYAVVGRFGPTLKIFLKSTDKAKHQLSGTIRLLADVGCGAGNCSAQLGHADQQISNAWRLIRRANVVLLLILTLIVLFSLF